ncbi:MAG: LTA synthase family protein [Lachnospiraceae bacterium]|nr:LTA synthase family protein [Lachnospiraceae bacterium]
MKEIIEEQMTRVKDFFKEIGGILMIVLSLVKKGLSLLRRFFAFLKKEWQSSRPKRAIDAFFASPGYRRTVDFLNKHLIFSHILLALSVCFLLEWLSRHSAAAAFGFVIYHTGAYLYNSFIVFVCFSPVFLVKRRTFLRMVIFAVFLMFGIANCVILSNRVTPFGFTDLNMVGDLLTMQNTSYFTKEEGMLAVAAILVYTVLMAILYRKGHKQESKMPYALRLAAVIGLFSSIPFVTRAASDASVLTAYFGNLAQGYLDYGYVYGFATSAFDRGMSQPIGYSQASVKQLLGETDMGPSVTTAGDGPNVIVMLLESFFDVEEASFIHTSVDPIPFFHELEANYSTGHLTVPVVGAGTCNTEFEVLTGMSCQFLGPGEYPQKTILKKRDCESFASDLKNLGYTSAVVHNNGGNFYSRANAFSMMGFDEFTSKELLDITEYTPLGSWATDDILVGGTKDALDATPGKDFVYTITVEAHGDYPTEKIIEDPPVTVTCEGKDTAKENQWEYYVNMIHNVDEFLRDYMAMLDARGEPTIVIMFGDHLPTMGLEEREVATGDLFQTKYVTWNNFGMEKADQDLTSYQLVSMYLDRLGIHNGTIMDYHQSRTNAGVQARSIPYMSGLEMLQYDILYGKRYAYGGTDLFPASAIVMGVGDVVIDRIYPFAGKLHIYGDNFTNWSRVYVNGEKVSTTYESGQCLTIDTSEVKGNGDIITVNQNGSNSTIFRTSNAYTYYDPYYVPPVEEEADENAAEEAAAEAED